MNNTSFDVIEEVMPMYITLDQLLLIGSYTVGIVGLVITCIKLVIDLIDRNNNKKK